MSSLHLAFETRGYTYPTNSKLYNAAPNTNTSLTNVCKSCSATTGKTIQYKPLKTTRYNANLSQKMKYGAFMRRAKEHAISNYDTVQFQYRNL